MVHRTAAAAIQTAPAPEHVLHEKWVEAMRHSGHPMRQSGRHPMRRRSHHAGMGHVAREVGMLETAAVALIVALVVLLVIIAIIILAVAR